MIATTIDFYFYFTALKEYSKTLHKKEYIQTVQTLKQKANRQHYINRQHIERGREGGSLAEDELSDGKMEKMGFKLCIRVSYSPELPLKSQSA